jgi:integrase
MKGCRPFATRDRALFIMGVNTGYRVSELLSLRVKDVYQYGKIIDLVTVARQSMKGKHESRTMPINNRVKDALRPWIKQRERGGKLGPDTPLFLSKKNGAGGELKAISRVQAWRVLNISFEACELPGKVATHSMRKSFADRAYDRFGGDIAKIAKLLGHKNVNSTINYLSFRDDELFDFVANM